MSDAATTARVLAAFDELARLFGPPAPRPPATADEIAREEYAMRCHDAAEVERYHDGLALDELERRAVLRHLGGAA